MRSVLAIVVAILAAALVYDGLALELVLGRGSPAVGWAQALTLLAPALLTGLLFATFVLMPLWLLIGRTASRRKRLLFLAAGAAAWLGLCAGLFASGVVQRGNDFAEAASLLLPGLVLVSTFALFAKMPTRERSGPATEKKGEAARRSSEAQPQPDARSPM